MLNLYFLLEILIFKAHFHYFCCIFSAYFGKFGIFWCIFWAFSVHIYAHILGFFVHILPLPSNNFVLKSLFARIFFFYTAFLLLNVVWVYLSLTFVFDHSKYLQEKARKCGWKRKVTKFTLGGSSLH